MARYVGRHGSERVDKVALLSAVPPFMLQTDDNPGGLPIDVFDEIRAGSIADRSQAVPDLADARSSATTAPGADVSQGSVTCSAPGNAVGHRNALESIAAFSATDFRGPGEVRRPDLLIHDDDDQIVPFSVGGQASAKLIDGAPFEVYPGSPHGITDTHKQELGSDLLAFLNS